MKNNTIQKLYREYYSAIAYCNEEAEKLGQSPYADDIEKIDNDFSLDLLMLGAFVMCADGKITEEETNRFNTKLKRFNRNINENNRGKVLEIVAHGTFDPPNMLEAFTLKSRLRKVELQKENGANILREIRDFYENIFLMYIDIMVSMLETVTPKERKVMLDCIKICCDYVANDLSISFPVSDRIVSAINNA